MKKLLIGYGIVFLMVFTASPATAKAPPLPCQNVTGATNPTCTGTLYFLDSSGTLTGTDTTASITFTPVTAVTDPAGSVPAELAGRLYEGTLTFTPPSSSSTSLPISVIVSDDGAFDITGVSAAHGVLQARGTYEMTPVTVGKKKQYEETFDMHGSLTSISAGTWVGTITGRFFP